VYLHTSFPRFEELMLERKVPNNKYDTQTVPNWFKEQKHYLLKPHWNATHYSPTLASNG
jgi:hypothetical protein